MNELVRYRVGRNYAGWFQPASLGLCGRGKAADLPNRAALPSCSLTILVWLLAFAFVSLQPARGQAVGDQVQAHFRAGQAALKHGDLPEAAKEFKKVLDLDPSLFQARINLGLVDHALGEYSLAASNLSVGLRQSPDLPGPTVVLGIDYLKLGEPDKAIPILQHALRMDAANLEGRRALARCYLAKADFHDTADEYRQVAGLNPDKAGAWYHLGHDYLDLAARLAYLGSHLYRDSAWGHRFLGDNLFQRNRWRDAAEEYQQALTLDYGQAGLHVSLGQAQLHAGKLDQAEAEFRLELQRDARSEPAWLGLAEMQLAKGHATAALDAVRKAWEISPEYLALPRGFPQSNFLLRAPRLWSGTLSPPRPGRPRIFFWRVS